MPGISLTAINQQFENNDPAPAFRFECELPDISSRGQTIKAPSSVLIQRISLPSQMLNTKEDPWGGWSLSFPTGSNLDDLNITFIERGDYVVYTYFHKWRQSVHDNDGLFGLPVDYWKNVIIYSLDLQGKRTMRHRLERCWPINVAPIEYDGASTMNVQIMVMMKCHKIISESL